MHPREQGELHVPGSSLPQQSPALSRALLQGLETPLAALRASMESLTQELWQGTHGMPAHRLDGVLREVELIGRNVTELRAFAAPPVPHPLSCSLEEIASAARRHFGVEQQARVLLARCEGDPHVRVDGPLLAGCLRRVIQNALEACDGPVLVVARLEQGMASFSVINESSSPLGPGWRPAPFQSSKPNHLGLGLTLTQRDVALLNGRLEFPASPGGQTCVRISIPIKEDDR